MVHSSDDAGRIVAVSDKWLEKLGYRRAEVLGRLASDFFTESSRWRSVNVNMPAFLKAGVCEDIEYEMFCKDGRIIDVLISAVLNAEETVGAGWVSISTITDISRLKAVEWSLRGSEGRYRALIEGQTDLVSLSKPDGELLFVNRAYARIHGVEAEQLVGRNLLDMVPVEQRAAVAAQLKAAYHADGPLQSENQIVIGPDAQTRWFAWVNRALFDDSGAFIHSTGRDVTERRLAEAALAQSEARLSLITANMSDLVICLGFDLRQTYVSPGSVAMLGYRPDEMLGQTPESICHGEDWPGLRAAFAAALRGELVGPLEFRALCKDGAILWLQANCNIDWRAEVIVIVLRDISRRRKTEEALRQSESKLRMITDNINDLVTCLTFDLRRIFVSHSSFSMLGYRPEELLGNTKETLCHADDWPRLRASFDALLQGDVVEPAEFRARRKDGMFVWLEANCHVDWRFQLIVVVERDVSARRALEEALAVEHELRRVTMESIGDGVITTDAAGCVTWLNPVAERMTGWLVSEAAGRPFEQVFNIIQAQTREPAENPLTACLSRGKITSLAAQTVLIARDGGEFGIDDSAAPIRSGNGDLLGMVLVFHDVTEQRRLSGEISYRATHDPLTGLLNRSEFDTRMRRLISKVQAERTENALLFIDLDQFKIVNDTAGHAVGDRLLQQVAKILTDVVRGSDTIARLGGDEFAVILELCPPGPALRLAQRICARMDEFRFVYEDRGFRIGASVGLVAWDERWGSVAALLQAADSACYAAKEAGRNQVHVWSDSSSALQFRQRQTQWASRLTKTLDEDRFALFVQRIEPLDGAHTGVHGEVLLRMVDEDGSLLAPGAFLPAAERFHLASRIDRWVLSHVIAWASAQADLGWLAVLSVNLSGQSVGDRMFHAWAAQRLREAGPEFCTRLCFEITETAAIANMADASVFLRQVRDVGVRVALDDFGAGASSFGYLKSMPVDFLKIDGQFIRDLLTDDLNQAAVRCFVEVASLVGMRTVAEFVDKAELMVRLRAMGIDFAQGYHIHRPAPIDELAPRRCLASMTD